MSVARVLSAREELFLSSFYNFYKFTSLPVYKFTSLPVYNVEVEHSQQGQRRVQTDNQREFSYLSYK